MIIDLIGNGMFLLYLNFPLDIGVVEIKIKMLGSVLCHF